MLTVITNTDIDFLLQLPFCRLHNRKDLPKVSGLYFVISEANKLLYIGQSVNIKSRWSYHEVYNNYAEQIRRCRIAWIELPKDLLMYFEQSFITWFKPPLNGRLFPGVDVADSKKIFCVECEAYSINVRNVSNVTCGQCGRAFEFYTKNYNGDRKAAVRVRDRMMREDALALVCRR